MTEDIDFDSRELCPDGNCTGVVEDGRCKLCGLAANTSAPASSATLDPRPSTLDSPEPDVLASRGVDPDWDSRRLCPDGNCTGILGSDGRCKLCGTSAAIS